MVALPLIARGPGHGPGRTLKGVAGVLRVSEGPGRHASGRLAPAADFAGKAPGQVRSATTVRPFSPHEGVRAREKGQKRAPSYARPCGPPFAAAR